jgi:hypothetical protein
MRKASIILENHFTHVATHSIRSLVFFFSAFHLISDPGWNLRGLKVLLLLPRSNMPADHGTRMGVTQILLSHFITLLCLSGFQIDSGTTPNHLDHSLFSATARGRQINQAIKRLYFLFSPCSLPFNLSASFPVFSP